MYVHVESSLDNLDRNTSVDIGQVITVHEVGNRVVTMYS